MSGHSKWVNIRLRKGSQDAKRGKLFTKAAKEIILAAKGGGDPSTNSRLRAAIAGAKAVNLPKDKIEAAIRKGTGQEAGGDLTEIMYEGHAPGGISVIVETATDNRNRTVAEIRHVMDKAGGAMGDSGCVAWMFDRKGVIVLTKEKYPDEDAVTEAVLDAGAEDLSDKDDVWEIYTSMNDFAAVREALEAKSFEMETAELQMVPKTLQAVSAEVGAKVMKFIDALEECEDVQNVYTNADFPEDMDI